ncbi:hypothetical protein E6W26_29000 [Pseudomonas aeruginosa]|nr:hypothetical protein [Pseudomonas aeruginosa]EKV8586197.1 hypothetical protein [Pseudomonas aeruginosa]ELN5407415.1 hypothetical protein [Pseudomonas aeruginosa]ELP1438606.1 hypothetical protein [Pseudomonas aeruginosa]THB16437.1 hypothetical protein E6W26_29000 [Pseudomonas aeruginosa]
MKWIKRIVLVLMATLSMGVATAEQMNVEEVAKAARTSNTPVDLSNVKLHSISNNDETMNQFYTLCSGCYNVSPNKDILFNLGYDTTLHPQNSTIDTILSVPFTMIGMAVGAVLLCFILWMVFNEMRGKGAVRVQYVSLIAIFAVFCQPAVMKVVWGLATILWVMCQNWLGRTFDLIVLDSESANNNDKAAYQPVESLNYYNNNYSSMIPNAMTEATTKVTLIMAKNVEFGKSGWFGWGGSDNTKATVLNNIEKNVIVIPVTQYKNDVPYKTDFIWNDGFEGFDARQYGSANILFSATTSSTDSQVESLDEDMITDVKKMADEDGAKAFPADSIKSSMESLEGIAFDMIEAGNGDKVKSHYEKSIADTSSNAVVDGMTKVYQKYASSGLNPNDFEKLYRAYFGQYAKSALGINSQQTIKGSWAYAQEAQEYARIYNASQYFDQNEFNIKEIAGFNLLAGGQLWKDITLISTRVNQQFVKLSGGRLSFLGVKFDDVTFEFYKTKVAAADAAMNLWASNVIQGADNGQRIFSGKYNSYKNKIVANWDKGAISSAGLNIHELGSLLNGKTFMSAASRNAVTITRYNPENYNGVDLVKIFGDTITKDVSNNLSYNAIDSDFVRLIYDEIANPSQVAHLKSVQQARNATGDISIGEMLLSYVQGQSDIITLFKEDTGLPMDRSVTEGMKYCNVSSVECSNRATGTVSSLYRLGGEAIELGVMIKMASIAIVGLDSIDFDADGAVYGKALGLIQKIPGLGTVLKVLSFGIKILAMLSVIFDLIANILIFIGMWSYVLKFLPTIQALMQQAAMPLLFIEGYVLLIIYAAVALVKRDLHVWFEGLKSVGSLFMGPIFWLTGYYLMLGFIYLLPSDKTQRAVYTMFAGDGGVVGMFTGFTAAYIALAMIHSVYLMIPKMTMDLKKNIFNDHSRESPFDAASDSKQFESFASTLLAEKTIINYTDKAMEAIKDGTAGKATKSFIEKMKEKMFPELVAKEKEADAMKQERMKREEIKKEGVDTKGLK